MFFSSLQVHVMIEPVHEKVQFLINIVLVRQLNRICKPSIIRRICGMVYVKIISKYQVSSKQTLSNRAINPCLVLINQFLRHRNTWKLNLKNILNVLSVNFLINNISLRFFKIINELKIFFINNNKVYLD